jgi:uncharacterized protein
MPIEQATLTRERLERRTMGGVVQSIWRYPVKGFTPEPQDWVDLTAGRHVPFDRLYAVEDGPSGFDPEAPQHISKQKFAVLAKVAEVALVRTQFDDATGVLNAVAPGHPAFSGALTSEAGRAAFAAWLGQVLGERVRGPLKVLPAPDAHRFMDDVEGFVSIINLASLRSLEATMDRRIDPRRFRANLYVEGWPAWFENDLDGGSLRVGAVELKIAKTIKRCVATHVDPDTGERDIEVVRGLFEGFGHMFCGIYASVVRGGRIVPGDLAELTG